MSRSIDALERAFISTDLYLLINEIEAKADDAPSYSHRAELMEQVVRLRKVYVELKRLEGLVSK